MGESNSDRELMSLERSSDTVLHTLTDLTDKVPWASQAGNILTMMRGLYQSESNEYSLDLLYKVKELEKYVAVDVVHHLAQCDGRRPYYLDVISRHLDSVRDTMKEALTSTAVRRIDHLTAEIQVVCVEYGFCSSLELVYSVDQATHLLNQLSARLDKVGVGGTGVKEAVSEMRAIVATFNGMLQAMTTTNIAQISTKLTTFESRLTEAFEGITVSHLVAGNDMLQQYAAVQFLLRDSFRDELFHQRSEDAINSHMIHLGTRGWLFDRVSSWLTLSSKPLLFISAQEGAGKSALAAALCKLHSHQVLGRHFFNVSHGSSLHNQVNGLVQNLAWDFCHVLPEYLNYLHDKLTSGAHDLSTWQNSYELLIHEPMTSLYGGRGSAVDPSRPRLVIIDGLDESGVCEWGDVRSFLQQITTDLPTQLRVLATVRTEHSGAFAIRDDTLVESLCFEERAWVSRHIKDIEIYLSSSVGAVLSGEDERGTPEHVDERSLQSTMDQLVKTSAGRFDRALLLMEEFARQMSGSGQFLGSVRKAVLQCGQGEQVSGFASPFRSYRDKEGRSVEVRVMRQCHYLRDKSRVAFIRGRHHANNSAP